MQQNLNLSEIKAFKAFQRRKTEIFKTNIKKFWEIINRKYKKKLIKRLFHVFCKTTYTTTSSFICVFFKILCNSDAPI